MQYRRTYQPGSTYFFTIVTHQRQPLFAESDNVQKLRQAIASVKFRHAFRIDAIVVLPDHIHCLLAMPSDDADYSTRIRLIKQKFTLLIGKPNVWQKRFWEHCIRNEKDYTAHFDYIHYNPVKHGLVKQVCDWRYSSFHKYYRKGIYQKGWGDTEPEIAEGIGRE